MRISVTPPTGPPPQRLRRPFPIVSSTGRGLTRHRRAWPIPSTMAGGGYIATPETPQRPMPLLAGAPDQSDTQATWLTQPCSPIVDHPATNMQAHQQTSFPIPYSPMYHTARAVTPMQWRSDPPPLDFNKSPYGCIPLPDAVHGPVILNPILAYSDGCTSQNERNTSQRQPVDVHRRHICAPATNPRLGSVTILLGNGRGITIHASQKGHSFVTVGDVLDAVDTVIFGKLSMSPPTYGGLGGSCACLSVNTGLHFLRSQHKWAGLTSNEEGFDIWDLRIG